MISEDAVMLLEHLRREEPGRLILVWDVAPMHRSRINQDFLTDAAVQGVHVERPPAHAPELNPGEGF